METPLSAAYYSSLLIASTSRKPRVSESGVRLKLHTINFRHAAADSMQDAYSTVSLTIVCTGALTDGGFLVRRSGAMRQRP
jgi:hypothetical protein